MRRFWKGVAILIITMAVLAACSSNSKSDSGKKTKAYDSSMENTISSDNAPDETKAESQKTGNSEAKVQSRMVIYNASIEMEVKKLTQVQDQISKIVNQMGGYIVQQNLNQDSEDRHESYLMVRVPQNEFQSFLDKVKQLGMKTKNQQISGQDVTEEYVDLKSRIKSKQLAEKRLTQFMNEAKDTKTLLEISNELAKVQEEIETIEGKIKYLENQTNLSTVNITLLENKVVIPGLENDQQNTWEKTKKQFMKSINFIISFFSGLFIFIIGYFPVIILLGLIGVIIAIVIRRMKRKSDNTIEK
ncbi:DUF4349 domain-containing protein [Heyndrickxia sp. NPDC080065]|uniref:DUF4349 domain-containing protein n=1 Tax=Heyndrickxia sp. NPDC080065 TaxID=3390568 RepID=UPI003D024B56